MSQPQTSESSFLKVAVTGTAGSGKTTVCNRLKELGLNVISADVLAREAVTQGSEAYKKIVKYFGKDVLEPDGSLNRPMLRRIVLKNEGARKKLEQFVHPEIIRRMKAGMMQAARDGDPIVVVEVPLLFEFGLENLFEVTINVSASHASKVKRLMERDNVSGDDAEALLNVQMSDQDKNKRAAVVIENNHSIEHMLNSVDMLYDNLFKKYLKK
jgi:dephospho-CoA kinase